MSGITLTEVANSVIPTPASGKATVFMSTDEGAPSYKDDGGTVHTLEGAAAPALTYSNHGNTGASEDIDWSAADVHRLVLNAATVALTCSNFPASGTPGVVRLWLEQDGTGGRDIDWSGVSGINWGDPGEPDWTTRGAGDVDIVDLMTVDGGTTVFAGLMGREGPAGATGAAGADGADGVGTVVHSLCNGRLTLTTAVPVTTSDVTAATTLYFTPYKGDQIGTYDGAAWSVNSFSEKSISLATLTSGLPYDVFIVDSTLALELLAWTNATTRATGLVLQDGVLVKSGATTRRYLGTICIAATGQCEDSLARRLVWNAYNRLPRPMKVFDSTDSWSYGTATWRAANNTTTNHVIDYVQGLSEEPVTCRVAATVGLSSGSTGTVGIGVDSTSANSADLYGEQTVSAATTMASRAEYRGWPGIGYHALNWIEYCRAGSVSFKGDDGVADMKSGIVGEVLG